MLIEETRLHADKNVENAVADANYVLRCRLHHQLSRLKSAAEDQTELRKVRCMIVRRTDLGLLATGVLLAPRTRALGVIRLAYMASRSTITPTVSLQRSWQHVPNGGTTSTHKGSHRSNEI